MYEYRHDGTWESRAKSWSLLDQSHTKSRVCIKLQNASGKWGFSFNAS